MIKHSLLTILLLSSTISASLYSSSVMSGEFDMFSFFSKKPVSTSTVHPSVGAELVEQSTFPATNAVSTPGVNQCQRVKVDSKTLTPISPDNMRLEVGETGFEFKADIETYTFVNNPDEFRFDLWETDQNKLQNIIPVKGLQQNSSQWVSYSIVDIACLFDGRLLVAINYHDPRPKIALYLYDISSQSFSLFTQSETNAQDHYDYFEQLRISDEQSLIKFYSDTKRKSAEIYHNYFNHVVLFSPSYPDGVKVLTLGIDDGNIKYWQLKDNALLLNTLDNRDHRKPIIKNWSLDLSKVLMQ